MPKESRRVRSALEAIEYGCSSIVQGEGPTLR